MKLTVKILLLLSCLSFTVSSYSAVTADTQMKSTEKEVDVTRRLRMAIMEDEHLSVEAKNVTIVTEKNSIFLKGHVNSKAEKVKIENLARARAGKMRVYNRLTY
jgi:hyperosmotically inducible protein